MSESEPTPDFGLYDESSHRGRLVLFSLLGLVVTVFLAGGLISGWLFLRNWTTLSSTRGHGPVQVQVPGGMVITVPEPAMPPVPGLPASDRAPSAPLIPLPEWTER